MTTTPRRIFALVIALSIVWAAVPAAAGPRPPGERGQRDVVADAGGICSGAEDANLKAACALRAQTFSIKELGNKYGETGVVDYSGNKNPAQQEKAMARQASSAVLSIDDVVSWGGQDEQKDMAAFYLCTYDQKARELGDRFDDGGANLAKDAVALATQLVSEERAVELGCLVP